MNRIFKEAIENDIFNRINLDFVDTILQALFHDNDCIHWLKGPEPDPNFNLNFYIGRMMLNDALDIKQNIRLLLLEFSMQEKFYFISKCISDSKKNRIYLYENHLFDYFDEMAKQHFPLGKDYKTHYEECQRLIKPHFDQYSHWYSELYSEITSFIFSLDEEFKQGRLTDESKIEVNEFILKHKPIFTLHPDLTIASIKNGKYKQSILNKNQIAILFDILCEKSVFLDFDKQTKAFFAALFTSESEQKLREEFIHENSIKGIDSSNPDISTYDYDKVIELIEDISMTLIEKKNKIKNK